MDKPQPSAGDVFGRNGFVVVAAILALTLLVYVRTITFEFVYDDEGQIVGNALIKSWSLAPQYFAGHVWKSLYPHAPGNYYRPLFLLWLLLNNSLFGANAVGWLASTIFLHLVATGLTYMVVRELPTNHLTASVTALLFGVHPAHLEAVAWVSGVTESLFSVAFLGAFLAYLTSRQRKSANWVRLSLALYAAALLCKETAIVLPILVFSHAWIYGARNRREISTSHRPRLWKAFWATAPYLPVAVAYLTLRSFALKGLLHPITNLPLSTIVLTWPLLLSFYLRQLIFPVGLSGFYDFSYVKHFDIAHVLLPFLLLLLVAGLLWIWQRGPASREVRFGTVWMFAPFLPLLNLSVLQQGDIAHDRYLYLPALGFALLVALGLEKLGSGSSQLYGLHSRVVLAAVTVCVLLCFGVVYQSAHWANDLALYSHGHRTAPHNATAANNLTQIFIKRGQYQEARALCEQVLRENPNFWLCNYNLGYLAYKTANSAEAEKHLVRAIQIDPSDPDQYTFLGLSRFRMGRLADAAADLQRAIAIKPDGPGYHFALGMVLEQRGDCAAAQAQFQAELTINPRNALAQQELAKCEQVSPGH